MRADAILLDQAMVTTSKSLESDPTMAQGLLPLDQVRRQVAAALFGPSEPVTQVGRFQVQKLIGSGGMGVVFAAADPQLGRTVALKLLQPLAAGERARERLLREAQAMARLQHPNVVGVHEAGVYGEQVYLVMEYVEDGTLADWVRVRARSWQEVVGVLAQAGDGLAAAHAAGLVHRDFKPANILMGAGRARISDFGLARTAAMVEDVERTAEDDGMLLAAPLTRTGALLGTPAYMAPEQLRGEPATAASDQFAFGVVLYEALVGHRPFQGGSVAVLLAAIEAGKMVAPARPLPSGLLAVIRRALMSDPSRRFPDMPALLTALRGVRQARMSPRALAAVGSAAVLAGGLLLALSDPATAVDHEPLARAHEYAGDVAADAAGRAKAGVVLDGAAAAGPGGPTPEASIHCDVAATACEIDRAFAAGLQPDPSAMFAGIRHMPAVKDGKYLGHKLYGVRPGYPIKLLGFKNGDLITGVDGAPVVEATFMTQIKEMLARGAGTLEFERKGAPLSVRISIR